MIILPFRNQGIEEKVLELEKDALLYMKTENFKIALEILIKAENLLETLSYSNNEHRR